MLGMVGREEDGRGRWEEEGEGEKEKRRRRKLLAIAGEWVGKMLEEGE